MAHHVVSDAVFVAAAPVPVAIVALDWKSNDVKPREETIGETIQLRVIIIAHQGTCGNIRMLATNVWWAPGKACMERNELMGSPQQKRTRGRRPERGPNVEINTMVLNVSFTNLPRVRY